MKRYALYFGRKWPQGQVGTSNFWRFLRDHADKDFPGYTVTDGLGVWYGEQEPVWVWAYLGTEEDAWKVRRLAQAYCREFSQACVAQEVSPVLFSFVSDPLQGEFGKEAA